MKHPAPLGKPNHTQRTCSRLIGIEESREILCGKSATEHVIYWWDNDPMGDEPGFDHGFCCTEHWQEFQQRWGCAGHHEVNAACGMPGSRARPDGPCFFDDLPIAEPERRLAVAVAFNDERES